MKKQILFSIFALVIGYSQLLAQTTCASPFSITYPATSSINTGFSNLYEYWVKITVPSGAYTVTLSKTATSDYQYQTALVYEGSCSDLLILNGAGQYPNELNALSVKLFNNGSSPRSFYLKLTNTFQQNINLNIVIAPIQAIPFFCLTCPSPVTVIPCLQSKPATATTSTDCNISSDIIGTGNCVEFANFQTAYYKVTGNVTFKDFVSLGAVFVVAQNSKLTLDHVRFTCCGYWGIVLQKNAQLKITGGTLIENGSTDNNGFTIISDNSTIVNTSGQPIKYAIEIDNGITNAFEGKIYIANYNKVSTPYPFKIQNFINTDRIIAPYSQNTVYPTVAALKTLSSAYNNGYNSPLVLNNELTYPSTLTDPMPPGYRYCGPSNRLYIKNVGYKAPNGTIYGMDIGAASATNTVAQNKALQNVFDRQAGVTIENSNVNIINSVFTEQANLICLTTVNSSGVLPENYVTVSGVGANKDKAPCEFYNANTAISVNDYYSVNILNNKFTSKQVYANTYSTAPGASFYSNGIFMSLKKNLVTNINNNTFTNLRTAINVLYPTNVIQLGTASIRNNLFRADIANAPATGSRFMADAIIINSLFALGEPFNGLTSLDIYKNNANLPFRFINLSGLKGGSNSTVSIDQNTALIRSEPITSTAIFNDQFALKTSELRAKCLIRDNNWQSFGKARPDQHFGTISINSSYVAYSCNTHQKFGTAFLMDGASNTIQGNRNYDNSYYNSERGFSIKNNATTTGSTNTSQYVDPITSNDLSADLLWGGNTFDTYVDGALASLNNIAIPNGQNSLPYFPVSNGFGAGVQYSLSIPNTCGTGISTGLCNFPQGALRSCLTPFIPCYDPNPSNCNPPPTLVASSNSAVGKMAASMTKEAQNQTTYLSFVPQSRRLKKLEIMETLMQDSSYLDSSLALKNWYTAQKNSNLGKLCKLQACLQNNSLAALQTGLLNFITPTTFDTYNKQYLSAYLYYQQKQSLLAAHITDLEAIAQSCPLMYGKLISQSRGLLNLVRGYYVHYNDNCPNGNSTVMRIINTSGLDESTAEISLSYTEKILSIRSELSGKQAIKIYDMQGKLIFIGEIDKKEELYQLSVELNKSIYNCVLSDNNKVHNQKLIIDE